MLAIVDALLILCTADPMLWANCQLSIKYTRNMIYLMVFGLLFILIPLSARKHHKFVERNLDFMISEYTNIGH